MRRQRTVAVSGPGGAIAPELDALAAEVGTTLAHAGIVVVTGGLDGVMAAAARGAHDAGGQVIGLLPGDDPAAGNPYLSTALATGLGQARNVLLTRVADGMIAVGGSWGTLSEVALAMRANKPVVWLRGWTIGDADARPVPLVTAATAAEAVAQLTAALGWSD